MRPKVKYQVIYMNRERYAISTMCRFFKVSRSGYYDYVKRIHQPDRNADLVNLIREQQEACNRTYYPKFDGEESGDRWASSYTNTKTF